MNGKDIFLVGAVVLSLVVSSVSLGVSIDKRKGYSLASADMRQPRQLYQRLGQLRNRGQIREGFEPKPYIREPEKGRKGKAKKLMQTFRKQQERMQELETKIDELQNKADISG